MKQLYLTIIIVIISLGSANAQLVTEGVVPVSLLYAENGVISVSQLSEEMKGGLVRSKLILFMPFYATAKQTLVLDASVRNVTILSDNKLESNLGMHWQLDLNYNFTIIGGTGLRYIRYDINKTLQTQNYSDPLSLPQTFNHIGANASLGVLHKYFWTIGKYMQDFELATPRPSPDYLGEKLFVTAGFRYATPNWEIRLPVQLENVLEFNEDQVFFGPYIAYKGNYLSVSTNKLWNMDFELGVMPYNWLRIGFVYSLHQLSATSAFGTTGSYCWQSKKLSL